MGIGGEESHGQGPHGDDPEGEDPRGDDPRGQQPRGHDHPSYGDREAAGELPRVRPGSILLASTDLLEDTFRRTAVYVIEHNDAGTLGVVINRMSQTAVHNLLPHWTDLAASPRAVYVGGPVKQDAALCLGVMQRGADPDSVFGLRTVSGRVVLVDLDADPEELAEVLEGVRIFAGYAGWGIGQLADELRHDSWMVASAMPGDLLAPAQSDVWSAVLRRQPWPLPLVATHPIDIARN